ncbi:YceI family protein [Candidatus Falkowbacteria bacterium]|nr:YceI family protein [Candidatus Falkowbacteria bacterium]
MNLKIVLMVAVLVIILLAVAFTVRGKNKMVNDAKNEKTVMTALTSDSTGEYVIDVTQSTVTWSASKTLIANYTDTGTIGVDGNSFTLENGEIKSGSVTINMDTIVALNTGRNVGMEGLTKHLKSADFFDVAQFPTAEFVITKVTKSDATNVIVDGNLTIKGITQPISFPAELGLENEAVRLRAEFQLDRTLWQIKYGSGKFFQDLGDKIIDDMFTLKLDIVGVKK